MAAVTAPRVRPYRRYLTSVFHHRLVQASGLILIICYVVAILIGSWSSLLWSWLPLGPTGIRAVSFFAFCCLPVFILRISQLQIGPRSTTSAFSVFIYFILRRDLWQLILYYGFSAWFFGEFYIFFSPSSVNLGWVEHNKELRRDKLNERPIYLRSVYLMLAVIQVICHISYAYNNVEIPSHRASSKAPEQPTHKLEPVPARIRQLVFGIAQGSLIQAGFTVFFSPFIYTLFCRRILWAGHMWLAKLVYNIPRSNANPETFPPCNIFLMFRAFVTGIYLLVMWKSASYLLSVLLVQEPLKETLPLSAQSKDPNGTLLSGLKAKKDAVKTYAFWELSLISQKFPERRKAIFADIDRTGGPTWTQMLQASLAVIKSVESRIKSSQPSIKNAAKSADEPTQNGNASFQVQTLPRLAPDTKPADNIFAPSPPPNTQGQMLEWMTVSYPRWLGEASPWTPSAKEKTKVAAEYAEQIPVWLGGPLKGYIMMFLCSWFGSPFRHPFSRLLSSIVLSSPSAQTAMIVDAVEATKCMLVASLSEDLYGKVQSTVPETVRTFTSTIVAIEELIDTMPPHWTDVDFEFTGAKVPEDVEIVLQRLKFSLEELLSAFKLYLHDVGLKDVDLRAAKQAVQEKPRKRPARPISTSTKPSSRLGSNRSGTNHQIPSTGEQASSGAGPASSATSQPQQPQRRKRLEERDRRMDLEFLNAAIPPPQKPKKSIRDGGTGTADDQGTERGPSSSNGSGGRRGGTPEMEQIK